MKTIVTRGLLGVMVMATVVWLLDLGVWLARGRAMGSVQVAWFAQADLKGGRTEFYPDGSGPVPCSQAVFPHGGANPCWYVSQHPQVFEH